METTEELLQEAISKVQEARDLVKRASKNESLNEYHGYGLTIVDQQLDIFSANESCYVTGNTSLEEMLEDMHEGKWENQEHED